jgi:hypothetical protein
MADQPLKELEDKEESDYQRERDRQVNASTSPPLGESVRMPAIWALEAFTPSQIKNLGAAAERLGWTNGDDWILNFDFTDKIADFRTRSMGGGWLNLGYILSEQAKRSPLSNSRRAPLPQGIERIRASLIQPFPSITILCLRFDLDNETATSLMPPLMEVYSTYREPISHGGWRIVEVEHQKKLAVEFARAALRSIATEWIANYFPGHFASHPDGNLVPTCELLMFEKQEAFVDRSSYADPTFLQALSVLDAMDTWQSEDLPGLYLKLKDRLTDQQSAAGRATLFGNVHQALATKEHLTSYGADKERQLVNWLHYLDRTLATWTVRELGRDFIRRIGRTRDAYAELDRSRIRGVDELKKLDAAFSDIQRNAVPFAHDLARFCRIKGLFFHDVFEFEPVRKSENFNPKLFVTSRDWLIECARYIQRLEEHLRFVAQQTAQMVTSTVNEQLAQSNLRLQRQIGTMTYIMLLLAALTAIAPLGSLASWIVDLLIDQ